LEDEDICIFFSNLAEKNNQDNETMKEVFRTLIKSTLRYRDNILKVKGVTVTVQDVQASLEWLIPAIKTGKLPVTDDKIRLDLLNLWMDELKLIV